MTGPGAQARNSIGLVLVAGMTIGTAFTLYFVPAIYLLIARDHRAAAPASALQAGGASVPTPGAPSPAAVAAGGDMITPAAS